MTEFRLHLSVRGLTDADLPSCSWAGSPKHVRELVHQIRRAEAEEIDYLAACTPVGLPVARGLTHAELGVEESSPRARALYERLGHRAFGRELDSWDVEAEDGSLQRYETMCTLMRKDLA
ncbi:MULTISPECIES: GNAT family N-acetyltransferase [unclassified Streptomyces]|uniref:GNAT family N-acetyltransferase n=1 Tax=unclassified Streptomyces TaxID=2593676 RepID=UPI00332BA702